MPPIEVSLARFEAEVVGIAAAWVAAQVRDVTILPSRVLPIGQAPHGQVTEDLPSVEVRSDVPMRVLVKTLPRRYPAASHPGDLACLGDFLEQCVFFGLSRGVHALCAQLESRVQTIP